jgi:hypothetical protein
MKKGRSSIQTAVKERRALRGELITARPTNRGRGLFAGVDFSRGELICGLLGSEEKIAGTREERDALLAVRPEINEYGADGAGGTIVVPRDPTVVGWHVANHSCSPNARFVTQLGEGLRARRAIKAGDEITVWYGWSRREVACLCGQPNCTGWIGLRCRTGDDGYGQYHLDDVRALVRSAASVGNDDAIDTAVRALRSVGRDDASILGLIKGVLGELDGERIFARLQR